MTLLVFMMMYVQLPVTKTLLPRAPSTGHPVIVSRLRHLSSPGTLKKPPLLDIDDRPCIPPSAMPFTIQPSSSRELSTQKELTSLRAGDAGTLGGGVCPTMEKASASQVREVQEAGIESSHILRSSTSQYSLPCEAENKHVTRDDNSGHSGIKIVTASADAETKTTSASHGLAVVGSSELSVGRDRIRPVNKLVKTSESTTEGRPSPSSKALTSFGRSPADQLSGELRYPLSDAPSKFASTVASAASAEQPVHTAMKKARAKREGSIVLRSLDSGEARVVSGLLTSLMQGSSGRLASSGRYKLVRSGKNSSTSVDHKSHQASHSKPLALVSLKHLEITEPL